MRDNFNIPMTYVLKVQGKYNDNYNKYENIFKHNHIVLLYI